MKPQFKRILVATKPFDGGLPLAATHARLIAEPFDAEITLVGNVYDSKVAYELASQHPEAIAAQSGFIEHVHRELEAVAQSLRDWGVTVSSHVSWSRLPYEGILRKANELRADLLVVGMHEPRLGIHTRLADTDWQLIRSAACPVLVAKAPPVPKYSHILAAIDPLHMHDEPEGFDHVLLETASAFAHALDAKLSVVHAFPNPADYELTSAVQVLPGVFYGTENMEALHRRAVRELVANYGVKDDGIFLQPGKAAEVICATADAQQVELIVLGCVSKSYLDAALIGTTAELVIDEAPCDVLVLTPPPLR